MNRNFEEDEIILEAKGVSKLYPGTVALNNVDFQVYKGKVNVLVGENGAGKSTLMKIISGIEQATSGNIYLEGKSVLFKDTKDALEKGIGIIHQELNLFNNMTVAQNMFLGRENTKHKILVDKEMHIKRTEEILKKLEQKIDPNVKVSELRVGQQQIIEIAKTMVQENLKVLIMDEPTSSLSAAEVDILFKLIEELKKQGLAIVYISHRLEELIRIGDYITILRDGNLVAEDKVKNIDLSWIVKKMVGSSHSEVVEKVNKKLGDEIFKVNNLSLPKVGGGYRVDNVSFSLRAGEILGVYGLLGSGRTETLECIMGLHNESKGELFYLDKKIKAKSISEQIDRGFALVPEDRQREGLIQTMSIEKNMTISSLKKYLKKFVINKRTKNLSVLNTVKDLEIKVSDVNLPILSLSGGNQQKVVIGKGILTFPKVLLLDEPSRGIDVGAKGDIFKLINKFAVEGLGVIVISSELKEIMSISDRVIVLSNGKLVGEFKGEDITEDNLVKASYVGHLNGNS